MMKIANYSQFRETILFTKILVNIDVLSQDFLQVPKNKKERILFDLTTNTKNKIVLDYEKKHNKNWMKNNKLSLLSVIWNHRNIRAEILINAMGKWVPCAYGPRNRVLYAQVCIGKINPDYNKELITVTWEKISIGRTRKNKLVGVNYVLVQIKNKEHVKNQRKYNWHTGQNKIFK